MARPRTPRPEHLKLNKLEYSDEICDDIIDYCCAGKSFETFCSLKRITMSFIEKWINTYPEFAEAVNVAICGSLSYWEDRLIDELNSMEPDSARLNAIKFCIDRNSSVINEKIRKSASEIKDTSKHIVFTAQTPSSSFMEGLL
jgi:hypothetical protein